MLAENLKQAGQKALHPDTIIVYMLQVRCITALELLLRQSTNTQRLSRISIQRMIDEEKLRAGALLYEQYYTAMLKRARRYLSDIYDAEDVVSNCWIRLLPRIHTLMEMDEPARSSYLLTAVQNESIDYYRRQHRRAMVGALDPNIADVSASEEFDTLLVCETFSSMLTMLPVHSLSMMLQWYVRLLSEHRA